MTAYVGSRVRRVEDPPLVTGRGLYAGDVTLPGLCHLAVFRSPAGHVAIRSIDTSSVLDRPGVIACLVARDFPEIAGGFQEFTPRNMQPRPRSVLAGDRARYLGEAIAVVVAERADQAQDALDALVADLEPLPASGDLDTAMTPGSALVHAGTESNLTGHTEIRFGDVEAAFGPGAIKVAATFRASRIAGAAMEPRTVVADYDAEHDTIRVWTSTQGVFTVRAALSGFLGMSPEKVVVTAIDVGGGFGPKATVYPEEVLVALVSRRLGRPVRWTATRSEDTATTVQAHGTIFEMEAAADPDGRLRGLRARLVHDIGAYSGSGANQPMLMITHLLSAYAWPAMDLQYDLCYTNSVPGGFVRGGGRPLGNYAVERILDQLARRLELDPLELRRRNLIRPEQMPYDTGFPQGRSTIVYDRGDFPKVVSAAADAFDYESARRFQAEAKAAGRLVGIGAVCAVEGSGFGTGEPATVHLDRDGTAKVHIGSTPHGQGHRTMAAQILADRLGWPFDRIEVVGGDTRLVAPAMFTAGSRSAIHVGNAVSLAARTARRLLLERAAEKLEADPVDLVLEQGIVQVKGAPGRSIPATEVLPEAGLQVSEQFDTAHGTVYPAGCHLAMVEVDPETGDVQVLRYVMAHDSGRVINPLTAEGQLHGGFVHGLGYALFEESVYTPDGDLQTASFLDYGVPGAPDLPVNLTVVPVEGNSEWNPEGVRGAGESATIPVPACISAAVEDALRGARPDVVVDRIPITPLRVHRLIAEGRA